MNSFPVFIGYDLTIITVLSILSKQCVYQEQVELTFLESSDQCVNNSLFTGGRNTITGELNTSQQSIFTLALLAQRRGGRGKGGQVLSLRPILTQDH